LTKWTVEGNAIMKIGRLFCLVFCIVLAESGAQDFQNEKDLNQISPEFEFITLAGQRVTSKELKGKIIVLDFWNSACNPCRKSMPQLEKFYQQYKNSQRVAVYLVNSGWESIEKAREFSESKRSGFFFLSWGSKYDLPFAYDSGSATMNAFNFGSNPSTIIIDAGFRIRVRHSGFIPRFYDFLTEHVEQYLAEQ
jgi:thiol-disulfide isomerase/thioredoxin